MNVFDRMILKGEYQSGQMPISSDVCHRIGFGLSAPASIAKAGGKVTLAGIAKVGESVARAFSAHVGSAQCHLVAADLLIDAKKDVKNAAAYAVSIVDPEEGLQKTIDNSLQSERERNRYTHGWVHRQFQRI